MDFSKLAEYGVLGIILSLVLIAIWKIIVWLMAFIKDDRKQQSEEREKWLCRLEKLNDAIDRTTNNIIEHDRRADERGKFVRSEHEKMITNLDEQAKVLARINGYKEDHK